MLWRPWPVVLLDAFLNYHPCSFETHWTNNKLFFHFRSGVFFLLFAPPCCAYVPFSFLASHLIVPTSLRSCYTSLITSIWVITPTLKFFEFPRTCQSTASWNPHKLFTVNFLSEIGVQSDAIVSAYQHFQCRNCGCFFTNFQSFSVLEQRFQLSLRPHSICAWPLFPFLVMYYFHSYYLRLSLALQVL